MRAFIAVDAPASQAIADVQHEIFESAKWNPRTIKPVNAENFHFTLMFLGEVDSENKIIEKLSEITFKPFEISLVGVGGFPSIDSARVVWIGVDPEGGKNLAELALTVAAKMKDLGFIQDKPFSPHLTIARARDRPLHGGRQVLGQFEGAKKKIACGTIDRLYLKKSELRPSGPVYSNVYTLVAVH